MAKPYSVRRAGPADAGEVAALFSASFRLLSFLPMRHSVEEDRIFMADQIAAHEIFVAEDDSGIVGFAVVAGSELRHLYTRPDRLRRGVASAVLERARRGRSELELWCFQANRRGRAFYEARGFRAILFTDGADNEEQVPDVRYRWEAAKADSIVRRPSLRPPAPPA